MRPRPPETLLCCANFPANTGFAWSYIEGVYARLADHLAIHGVRTLVSYPPLRSISPSGSSTQSTQSTPLPLQGSAAVPVELDTARPSLELVRFLRRENVRALYLTDRPPLHWSYPPLRAATGVRRIVVHDHSSGSRVPPRGARRAAKWLAARAPGFAADAVVAVSDFVARRQLEVGLLPASRVQRVYNAVQLPERGPAPGALRALLKIAPDRPLVACAARCTPEKGLATLLRALELLPAPRPALACLGDGPAMPQLRALRDSLSSREDIFLVGYRADASSLIADADVCAVPSVWEEAFGLAVVEAMAQGKPVVASRVGGIPELVRDGVDGLLVPPGRPEALARALAQLLADPLRARRMGRAARKAVRGRFGLEEKLRRVLDLLEPAFGLACVQPGAVPARAPASLGGRW